MSSQCNKQAACVPECNKCDYAWNWKLIENWLLPRDHFASCTLHFKKSILVIICSHLCPGRNNMFTIHGETLSVQRGTTWQLNWWPLNKYSLKLMLSNRLEHVYRRAEKRTRGESQSNYSIFDLAHCGLTRSSFRSICLSHFFSLTPSSSFLPTSLFVREN